MVIGGRCVVKIKYGGTLMDKNSEAHEWVTAAIVVGLLFLANLGFIVGTLCGWWRRWE